MDGKAVAVGVAGLLVLVVGGALLLQSQIGPPPGPAAQAQPPIPFAPLKDSDRFAAIDLAPDDQLLAIAKARLDLLNVLSKEAPQACYEYYFGDFPAWEIDRLPKSAQPLATRHRSLMETAAATGQRQPVRRPRPSFPNGEPIFEWQKANLRGREFALAEGAQPKDAVEGCETGILEYRAINSVEPSRVIPFVQALLRIETKLRQSAELRFDERDHPEAHAFADAVLKRSPSHYERLVDATVLRQDGNLEAGTFDAVSKAKEDRVLAEIEDMGIGRPTQTF